MPVKKASNFRLANSTKAKLPSLAFAAMKEAVLGKEYDLTLQIVSLEEIHILNWQYRKIDKPTDILSFPYSKTEGEMFINIEETKKEALKFGRTFPNFLAFLFIHGLVHLAGHDHSSTMERIEARFRKQFKV
ncbi:MAG: rRNA maturation RNase YbeY [Patescibacteria group bacterium]